MPDSTLNLKGTQVQGKSNSTSPISAKPVCRSPHMCTRYVWSPADHTARQCLHCPGLSTRSSAVKEHQICSCCISSVLTNRRIICLYSKAKGKQLKEGFVQLSVTFIFALRYAKGYGHCTARERKWHCGPTTTKQWSWAQSNA